MNWRPIETAPKDGTAVLVHDGRHVHIAEWSEGPVSGNFTWRLSMTYWADESNRVEPTHWMALPEPPK